MEEVTLRNGEIAFLASGTVIMNVDTAIELKNKLEKQEAEKEQSPEEAMENAMLLLALLFGPEILDKKPVTQKPGPVVDRPMRDPSEDSHPKVGEKFYFPEVIVDNSGSAKRHFEDGMYVYVDNYGNVFGTMGECDYRHNLSSGSTQKIISGKQRLGYASHAFSGFHPEAALKDVSPYKKTNFAYMHIVSVVKVPKSAILPNKINTRESRYRAWKNAMLEANKLIDNIVDDEQMYNKITTGAIGYAYSDILRNRKVQVKKFKKEYGADYLNPNKIEDIW